MRYRAVTLSLLITAALAILPGTACACSCAALKPEEQVRQAAAVFTGTVVATRAVEGGPGGVTPPIVYTFRADQVYKGAVRARYQVATNRDSAACGFGFESGSRYLVFASSGRSGLFAVDPGVPLSTSLCAGTQEIRAGTAPLRSADGIPEESPLPAGLLTALGTPDRPPASPGTAPSPDSSPLPGSPAPVPSESPSPPAPSSPPSLTSTPASGGGPAPVWVFPAAAGGVLVFASAGWWLIRRRTGPRP
jgi:hypothetical protein